MLRCLISRVILSRPTPDNTNIKIVWISGGYWEINASTNTKKTSDIHNYGALLKRIKCLWKSKISDKQMARQLTEEGFRSARTATLLPHTIMRIRVSQGWRSSPGKLGPRRVPEGCLSASGLAKRLGISRITIYRYLKAGKIDSKYILKHTRGTLLIKDDPGLIKSLQKSARTKWCK